MRCSDCRMPLAACRPPGFTLVEVMVALTISAMVLLGARLMLTSVAHHADRISARARATDREVNAERLLRALVQRIEVGTDEAMQFGGTESEARFSTWCEVPAGWLERCVVNLTLDSALAVTLPLGVLVLRDSVKTGALRYLNSVANGGEWFRRWGTGITTPLGIGIVLDRDTLILRIGERG
ncbi:MAG: type II secretion system protein J [Gemmatimonadaceae bacterium]